MFWETGSRNERTNAGALGWGVAGPSASAARVWISEDSIG